MFIRRSYGNGKKISTRVDTANIFQRNNSARLELVWMRFGRKLICTGVPLEVTVNYEWVGLFHDFPWSRGVIRSQGPAFNVFVNVSLSGMSEILGYSA